MALWFDARRKEYASDGKSNWIKRYCDRAIERMETQLSEHFGGHAHRHRAEDVDYSADQTVKAKIDSMALDISHETLARQEADEGLKNDIKAEAESRSNAVSAIENAVNFEASARTSADTALNTRIDIEAADRQSADTVLEGRIDTEASSRRSVDEDLRTKLSAEAAARKADMITAEAHSTGESLSYTLRMGEPSLRITKEAGTGSSFEIMAQLGVSVVRSGENEWILSGPTGTAYFNPMNVGGANIQFDLYLYFDTQLGSGELYGIESGYKPGYKSGKVLFHIGEFSAEIHTGKEEITSWDFYASAEPESIMKEYNTHKGAAVLDHPSGSVTTEKIRDGAVTETKLSKEFTKYLKVYPINMDKRGSGNNILNVSIDGVTSYDDLDGKIIMVDTLTYTNSAKGSVYFSVNDGLGNKAIRRMVSGSTESESYEVGEITRHTTMLLYIIGGSVYWINPQTPAAGQIVNNMLAEKSISGSKLAQDVIDLISNTSVLCATWETGICEGTDFVIDELDSEWYVGIEMPEIKISGGISGDIIIPARTVDPSDTLYTTSSDCYIKYTSNESGGYSYDSWVLNDPQRFTDGYIELTQDNSIKAIYIYAGAVDIAETTSSDGTTSYSGSFTLNSKNSARLTYITESALDNGSVYTEHLSQGAVTSEKLRNGAVTEDKLGIDMHGHTLTEYIDAYNVVDGGIDSNNHQIVLTAGSGDEIYIPLDGMIGESMLSEDLRNKLMNLESRIAALEGGGTPAAVEISGAEVQSMLSQE